MIDRVGGHGRSTRQGWPVWITWPTTPRVVGNAQFAALDAQGGPADQGVVGPVPKEDAGPIGAEQPRGGLGHLDQQRLDLPGLVPLTGDFQNRFQAADTAAGALL